MQAGCSHPEMQGLGPEKDTDTVRCTVASGLQQMPAPETQQTRQPTCLTLWLRIRSHFPLNTDLLYPPSYQNEPSSEHASV